MNRLSDFIDIKNGKSVKADGGAYPIYGGNGILGYTDSYNYEDVVVIGRVGANCGSVHLAKGKVFVSDNALAAVPKNDSSSFNYYLLKTLNLNKAHIGSSQPLLTQGILNNINLNIENNRQSQQKIAGVLSALDDKIELNRKENAELEQMARTLYDYWFVQFDFPFDFAQGKPAMGGKPYKSSGGAMKNSPELNRPIPTAWEVLKLEDRLVFDKGTEPGASAYSDTKNDENDTTFYRVGDIDGNSSTYINAKIFKPKLVSPSDVIVTFDGSVGKIGFGLDGAISGGLRHIYDKEGKISNATIYSIFSNEYIQKTIERYATGSVILHASSSIKYLAIPFDERVFAEFQKITQPLFDKIIANRQQSQNLASLRDWLLPMLMNGQVRVKSGQNHE